MKSLYRIKNNKGLSLVEVIISVAIVSIVLVTITSFMVTGTKMFGTSSNEIQLQQDAQLVLNNIENRIVDAQLGAAYEAEISATGGDCSVLTILNEKENEYIFWVTSEKKIYYVSDSASTPQTGEQIYNARTGAEVLAEDIEDFSVEVKKSMVGTSQKGSPKANVKLKMENKGRLIDSSKTIAFRNDIVTGTDLGAVYSGIKNEYVAVEKVLVTPDDVTLVAPTSEGATVTYQYNARVLGQGQPSQVVTWDIVPAGDGSVPVGVSISATGLVTIDHTANSGSVTVRATATKKVNDDGTADVVSDTATLKVSKIDELKISGPSKYYAGTYVQFNTDVDGLDLDDNSKKVKYTVISGDNNEIVFEGEYSGLLYIDPKAQGKSYTVKVTSVYDPNKSATFDFNVEDVSLTETGSGLAEAVRGDSIELKTALIATNLAESELNISWEITDDAGLGSRVSVDSSGKFTVDKNVNYEKEYDVEVKATVSAGRLHNPVEKLIKVHIPVVSLKFVGAEGGGTIDKNATKTFELEATGMVLAPEDVYVTTNPALSNCIVYATKDGVQLSIGDGNKATSFDLVATLKNTNTSTTMKITIK